MLLLKSNKYPTFCLADMTFNLRDNKIVFIADMRLARWSEYVFEFENKFVANEEYVRLCDVFEKHSETADILFMGKKWFSKCIDKPHGRISMEEDAIMRLGKEWFERNMLNRICDYTKNTNIIVEISGEYK